MNPAVRRLVLSYSVRNRRKKVARIRMFMTAHGLESVVLVGVAGDSDEVNEDIVEHELSLTCQVLAAVSPCAVPTALPLIVGDGRALPFADGSVDVVLSNAVIEHVGSRQDQQEFVAEHLRVGRAWIITTPNRWFPVESHTSVVFKHWSPRWRAKRDEFTRLLSRREFEELLPPGATLLGRPWSPTFTATGLNY